MTLGQALEKIGFSCDLLSRSDAETFAHNTWHQLYALGRFHGLQAAVVSIDPAAIDYQAALTAIVTGFHSFQEAEIQEQVAACARNCQLATEYRTGDLTAIRLSRLL